MDNAHDEILNENTIRQSKFPENTPGERRNGWEKEKERDRVGRERLERILVNIDYFWEVKISVFFPTQISLLFLKKLGFILFCLS